MPLATQLQRLSLVLLALTLAMVPLADPAVVLATGLAAALLLAGGSLGDLVTLKPHRR